MFSDDQAGKRNLLWLWRRRGLLVKLSRRSSLTISEQLRNQQADCWFFRFFWVHNRTPLTDRSRTPERFPRGWVVRERAWFPRGELSSPGLALRRLNVGAKTGCRPFHGRLACSRCASESFPRPKNVSLMGDWKPQDVSVWCCKQLFFLMIGDFVFFLKF